MKPPPPHPGRDRGSAGFHGLRCARLTAGGASPVATILGPFGTAVPSPEVFRMPVNWHSQTEALEGGEVKKVNQPIGVEVESLTANCRFPISNYRLQIGAGSGSDRI